MDENVQNPLIAREVQNIYTQNAHKTCSMFFLWDMLFYHTFFVSLYLLVFRLFFTFLFAFIFFQQWHVQKMWNWFPIVAFNSDIETFTKMNSYAIVVTGVTVLGFFIFQCFAQYQEQRKYKIYAWYTGVLMLLVQYAILIAINQQLRFSINTNLWFFFIGFIVIATGQLYIWQKYLRNWKFKQFIRAEKKREKKLKRKKKKK
ncbi:MAG: hypothetical protein CR972_03105 [Candidatus Moraniibacteriota bacterium]|nr:MAG: hypothetical protein CR972_03105 [Candidatus Moranbacteria bacterium]